MCIRKSTLEGLSLRARSGENARKFHRQTCASDTMGWVKLSLKSSAAASTGKVQKVYCNARRKPTHVALEFELALHESGLRLQFPAV